jgi:hypothetical protein
MPEKRLVRHRHFCGWSTGSVRRHGQSGTAVHRLVRHCPAMHICDRSFYFILFIQTAYTYARWELPNCSKNIARKIAALCSFSEVPYLKMTVTSVPEFIDPVFYDRKWAFWACIRENGVYKFGHLSLPKQANTGDSEHGLDWKRAFSASFHANGRFQVQNWVGNPVRQGNLAVSLLLPMQGIGLGISDKKIIPRKTE